MNDQWTRTDGTPVAADWSPGLPPGGEWTDACGCEPPTGTAIVDDIFLKGVPATVSSLYWQVSLNDGAEPPNYAVNHLDGNGTVIATPMQISGVDDTVQFNDPVLLSRDPVEDMEAATKQYADAHGGIPDAPAVNWYYGRFNNAWAVIPIQSDAPSDGQAYVRQDNAWALAFSGSGYLPLTGGIISGNLTVTGVTTIQGPNSFVLNAPMGQQRAILGQTSGLTRWQLQLGDQVAEGVGNAGSNFSLTAYATAGGFLGTWLSISRADGSTVFSGSGVTIQGGLAVNGLLAINDITNLYIPGGNPGDVLTTNGAAHLSWTTPAGGGGGGIPDAPADGVQYGRQNEAWTPIVGGGGSSVTVSDVPPSAPVSGDLWWDSVGGQMYVWFNDGNSSQWVIAVNAASLLPPATTTTLGGVKVDGTSIKAAVDGTISTVLVPMGDNRIINGDMRIDQRNAGNPGTANDYTVDRWVYGCSLVGKGTWQQAGAAPAIYPGGFGYCLLFTSSSAYTALAADYFAFQQRIEADLVTDFQWGTANAQPVTLSFWAFSSKTGTFSGSITNIAQTRCYPFTFSIPAGGVWTRITVTIPGDTAGTWVMSGNAASMAVWFDLGCGTGNRGPAGAWDASSNVGVTGAQSIVATNGAQFGLTGVKLEIGSVATPFNRQSLAKSMADCQRYYTDLQMGWWGYGSNFGQTITYPVQMRATPTVAFYGTTYSNASGLALNGTNANTAAIYAVASGVGGSFCNTGLTARAEL
jgi:hypothetical protein